MLVKCADVAPSLLQSAGFLYLLDESGITLSARRHVRQTSSGSWLQTERRKGAVIRVTSVLRPWYWTCWRLQVSAAWYPLDKPQRRVGQLGLRRVVPLLLSWLAGRHDFPQSAEFRPRAEADWSLATSRGQGASLRPGRPRVPAGRRAGRRRHRGLQRNPSDPDGRGSAVGTKGPRGKTLSVRTLNSVFKGNINGRLAGANGS